MDQVEPQSASDYDERTTVAVKSVLVEIGQILGSYKGKFAVIGGAVPWLPLGEADMPHVGTIDVDPSLDAEALGMVSTRRLADKAATRDQGRAPPTHIPHTATGTAAPPRRRCAERRRMR